MKLSGLSHFPLGQSVPARDHAVCVSLPTFKDVIGYEEKKPEVHASLRTGYPRFVRNHLINKLALHYDKTEGVNGYESFFFTKSSDCESFNEFHGRGEYSFEQIDGLFRVRFPKETLHSKKCRLFQQHSGTGISSRHAEDILFHKGLISQRENSDSSEDAAKKNICEIIAKAHGPEISSDDVLLSSSGANAFYSLFKVALQHARLAKKRIWIRLGWLYLDTIEVMQMLTGDGEELFAFNKPADFEELKTLFQEYGHEIAGVVTEFPTNPLLHSFDIVCLRQLCDRYGSLLIIDPTIVSPKNAKVSKMADVVVNSLTKYANCQGDVMMGSLVFPKHSIPGRELMASTAALLNSPYKRDLIRLDQQISHYNKFIEETNISTMVIAEFLQHHPAVKKVYWAYQPECRQNYSRLAGEQRPGCVISFELNGDFKLFYDSLQMLKSPSFGTEFSLCCPYVYLAHYEMIKSPKGRAELMAAGISPEILRLSIGLEPVEDIKTVLDEALVISYSKS